MRLLCLHGRGTNSDIFEAQLGKSIPVVRDWSTKGISNLTQNLAAPLISRLPKHYEFDFVDAPVQVNPAPGIGGLLQGPYLAWYRRHFTSCVAEAHEYLAEVIEETGPYDGVVGFSQGAAVATSFMLSHQHDHPDDALPFRFAIFLCGVLPVSPSLDQGVDSTPESLEYERAFQQFFGLTDEEIDAGSGGEIIQIFDPILTSPKRNFACREPRIDIPVLHVIGEKDEFSSFSRYIASLCTDGKSSVYFHAGGHELPRAEEGMDKVAELFERTVERFRTEH